MVILSPSPGNDKTLFINGGNGDDFVIDNGSSLNVSAGSPVLSINVKAGATASISGTLIFSGTGYNTLNSADSLSIKFRNGSVLNQLCPGSIFTSSGINNSAVFEGGSTLKINNINASAPFGLPAPDSKVKFVRGSSLDFACSCINARVEAGRY